ncbi:uncharacterized protein LOC115963993 isoform X2 [Quercus lobata]|nr:uncharacterized protein LOC115963993 isoform X2 [Quercus lobata]
MRLSNLGTGSLSGLVHLLATLKLVPPASLEKRKTVSKKLDIGNLPSRQGNKKQKVDSSMPSTTLVVVLNPAAPIAKSMVPKIDASLTHPDAKPSNPSLKAPLSDDGPLTVLRSENLAWNSFKQVVRNEDVSICYDMSIKEFEHSTIHDLFKFMAASRQVVYLDKERIRMKTKIRDMEESSRKVGERRKLGDEVKELKNLAEELKVDIVEKDTCLDHL